MLVSCIWSNRTETSFLKGLCFAALWQSTFIVSDSCCWILEGGLVLFPSVYLASAELTCSTDEYSCVRYWQRHCRATRESSTTASSLGLWLLWWYFSCRHAPWCLKHQTEICWGNEKIDAKIWDNIVYSGVWFLKEIAKFWYSGSSYY